MIPIAKIDIKDGVDRGVFATADQLRSLSSFSSGDIAQVYTLKRIYKYDSAAGTIGDDDGDTIIRPNTVSDANGTGRWVATSSIQLTAANSVPSDQQSTITNYEWKLLFHPALYTNPSIFSLIPFGVDATLNLPSPANWIPGGIKVFLVVSDSSGAVSLSNPFNPEIHPQSMFDYILRTPNYGFAIPPAGSRNWHKHYQEVFTKVDGELKQAVDQITATTTFTTQDKNLSPTVSVTSDNTPIPGVTISNTPANNSYVRVYVNGIAVKVGDGTKSAPCYFSDDGGVTAKAIADIAVGDSLCWNPSIAGYNLEPADSIDMDYLVTVI